MGEATSPLRNAKVVTTPLGNGYHLLMAKKTGEATYEETPKQKPPTETEAS